MSQNWAKPIKLAPPLAICIKWLLLSFREGPFNHSIIHPPNTFTLCMKATM